ncbi:MAG: hypothetical protein ABI692_14195 [Terracoccus sp.]
MLLRKAVALIVVPAVAVVVAQGSVSQADAVVTTSPLAPTTRIVHQKGTAAYRPVAAGGGALGALATEIPRAFGADGQAPNARSGNRPVGPNRSFASERGLSAAVTARAAAAAASEAPAAIIRNGPQLVRSFAGLNARDQRTANQGNQFSVEPPDQGLCVGGGHVVEAVNTVLRVYDTHGGGQTGVVDLNTFYGYPAQIDRSTGAQGPFLTDPSCLYDPTTKSFFLVVLTLDVDPATGAFTGTNHLDIAVAADPTATWKTYSLAVTNDGSDGTPVHPNCPCIGDYPHMGVDSRGFYVTTNEYSFFGPQYNSAQVYAFSKRALSRGDSNVLVTEFDTTAADRGLNGFTIWPAQSPSTSDYQRGREGTAYFLSSNAAEEATGTSAYVSNSVVTWSLTGTNTLDSRSPHPRLTNTRVPVATYSLPPLSNQKTGPAPLRECLNRDPCATLILGSPNPYKPEALAPLDSNDTRMQQVTYVNGRLYGALDTAAKVGGATKAGIAWYVIRPQSSRAGVNARLLNQGQLSLAGNNLIYPAIGLNTKGQGVMAFTIVGKDYYPSAGYSNFDGRTGASTIYLAAAGLGPQDGFTGYKAFGSPAGTTRPRWGDYGATAVDGSNVWIASEYIGQSCTLAQYRATPFGSCDGTRVALANWGTRISLVRPRP